MTPPRRGDPVGGGAAAAGGSVSAALNPGQQEELARAPLRYRGILLKAFQGAASPRKAIQANCLTCTHFNIAEIRDCAVLRCALRPYRPYQDGETDHQEGGLSRP